MKLRLPYALTAALALCWGTAHAELTQTDVLRPLMNGDTHTIAWESASDNGAASNWGSNWNTSGEISADAVARALNAPERHLTNEGWHAFMGKAGTGWTLNTEITAASADSFTFTGRGAHGGSAVVSTLTLSSIAVPEGATADGLLAFNISFDAQSQNGTPLDFYIWSWDGTTATKLKYDSTAANSTSTGNAYKVDLTGMDSSTQLVVMWYNGSSGGSNVVSNLATAADFFQNKWIWTGTTDSTWGANGNWTVNSDATAIGAYDAVTFDATSENRSVDVADQVTVRDMTVSGADYTFSGKGAVSVTKSLTITDASATIGTDLTLGASTTIKMTGEDASLTINGDVTLQGGIKLDGGRLTLNGGLAVADTVTDLSGFSDSGSFLDSESGSTVNGYQGKLLVSTSNGGTVSLDSSIESVSIGGKDYTIQTTANGITVYGNEYYVNEGKVVYGGTGDAANSAASATGITLAGGELEMKQALAQGVITATGNATLTIDEGVSVSNTQINHTGGTLLLNGDGEFDYGANKAFSNNFKLGADWTGTVVVSGITDGSGGLNLLGNDTSLDNDTSLGNADSTVKLNGAKVWLALQNTNTNMNTNLELEDAGSTSALNVSAVSSRQYNFNKTIKGSGTMEVSSTSAMGDSVDGKPGGFNFIGNIEGWDGTILDSAASGTKYFRIADGAVKDGGTLAVNLKNTGAGTANFFIDQSDATIIDSDVTRTAGTLNLTLSNTGKKTLNGTIDATSVAITGGVVKLGSTASLSAKNAAGESGKGVTIITKPAARTFGLVPSGDGEGEPAEGGATVTPGAGIQHATVSATGITKETGYAGYGSIDNATITIDGGTEANKFSITHMEFTNSIVDLANGAFVSMDDVVIGAGSAVVNDSGNTYTASNMKVVLTAADVAAGTVSFDQGDGTVTLTSNVLGTDANLSGTFDLTLADGFLKALQLEVLPDYSGTLIIDFGSTVSLADITPGTLDVTEYADDVTLSKVAANGDGAITGVIITFVDNDKAIPEPATATLSLLALAGLAARRRRKN